MTTSRGPVLSPREAATYTGLGYSTFRRLAAECSAELPVVHLTPGEKGRRGFRQADLDAYLDKRTADREAPARPRSIRRVS